MLLTMFLVFIVHVLLGVPLFMALLVTAVAGFLFIDAGMLLQMMPQQFFSGINVFSLMAIPLFILAGNLLNATGMTSRLMDVARALVGHWRGGMGHVNVVGSVFFAGVNGSAVADTSALGSLLVPQMKKDGYSTAFAAGLTAGSSLIGPIIPPSIFMILYSALTNTSVGDLFLSGIVPGLLLGVAFMLMNAVYAFRHRLPKSAQRAGWDVLLRSMFYALPALVAPFIIVAGIVMGKVTPTESGALTAAYVGIFGLLSRTLSLRGLWTAFAETARLTSAIFLIIAASSVVSWLLAYAQAPAQFAGLVAPFADNGTAVLLLISLVTFVTGMFMEEVSALTLLTPVFYPVAMAAGVDPVHLGIVVTLNITIALITPPMGACVYVAAAVSKLDILDLFKTIWPFVAVALAVLLLIIFVPGLALWLPNLFKGA